MDLSLVWTGKARKITIDPGPAHPPRLNESPLVISPALPFRLNAPPSRPPRTSANILACLQPEEDQQSGLSTNQSHRIYSPFRTGDVTTVNVPGSQTSPDFFKSSRATVYQQRPRFHTNFYNNGPANYQNTRPNLGTLPALRSSHILIPNSRFYLADPMFPASHTEPNWSRRAFFSIPCACYCFRNTSKPAAINNYSAKASSMHTEDIDISAQYNLLISRLSSVSFPPFTIKRSTHLWYH